MEATELWKPIPFNESYEVSTHGNFRNAKTKRQKVFDIEALKSIQSRIRVDVKNNIKKGSGFYMHRLVAMTFIPIPQDSGVSTSGGYCSEETLEVNHIDGNPYNNCVSNLEWITRADNMRHYHENREKYKNKNLRQVLLCCSETHTVLETYKCIDDCIDKMALDISYGILYNSLTTSVYEKPAGKNSEESLPYCTNKYVGVRFNKTNEKYIASYRNKYIGSFKTDVDAAKAFDEHLRSLKITPCYANFPVSGELQAVVGKKKYNSEENNYKTGMFELIDKNQYLKFAEEKKEQIETIVNNDLLEWRVIDECPNYSVSNTGLVKHTRHNRILKGYNRNGYLQVTIQKDNEQSARLVHRLVAAAFIHNDDPVNRIYVDHIDTDPRNNNVSNLRWVTSRENMNNDLTRQNISAGHLRKSPRVYMIEIQTGIVNIADNAIAMETSTGVKSATVQSIANYYKKNVGNLKRGQQKTHQNKWIFLYENEYNMRTEIIKKCITDRTNAISVVQSDYKTGEIIATYSSLYEASKKLNINYSGISQVYNYHKYDDNTRPACYKLKSTHGFVFKDNNN